jgi:hypothetical protein
MVSTDVSKNVDKLDHLDIVCKTKSYAWVEYLAKRGEAEEQPENGPSVIAEGVTEEGFGSFLNQIEQNR